MATIIKTIGFWKIGKNTSFMDGLSVQRSKKDDKTNESTISNHTRIVEVTNQEGNTNMLTKPHDTKRIKEGKGRKTFRKLLITRHHNRSFQNNAHTHLQQLLGTKFDFCWHFCLPALRQK